MRNRKSISLAQELVWFKKKQNAYYPFDIASYIAASSHLRHSNPIYWNSMGNKNTKPNLMED